MLEVSHKTLEELKGEEFEYIQNTYYDAYVASNKRLSFIQLDDLGNMVSITFLKETEMKLGERIVYGCEILGVYGSTEVDRLSAIKRTINRISQWVLKKDTFFYFYYLQSTKETIENDLIDYDAEKFIFWRDKFTLEYYAYKVIDRTALAD
jgi:hypothetical protein